MISRILRPRTRRCTQCWKVKSFPSAFIGRRGKPVRMCTQCQGRYYGWGSKTPAEKAAVPRTSVPALAGDRVLFFPRSGNRKLGPIPVSITGRASCPTSCSFYEAGCYALYHVQSHHWRRVPEDGMSWAAFCAKVKALPEGTIWRHNEAGDLPHKGAYIDSHKLMKLVLANKGRRGFTFTHHDPLANQIDIAIANREGFTINISADSLEEADRFHAMSIAPVAVVVPSDAPVRLRTPMGRRVVICPAETVGMTCLECQLCAQPQRKAIVGFRAHGQSKALVSELVRSRRSA